MNQNDENIKSGEKSPHNNEKINEKNMSEQKEDINSNNNIDKHQINDNKFYLKEKENNNDEKQKNNESIKKIEDINQKTANVPKTKSKKPDTLLKNLNKPSESSKVLEFETMKLPKIYTPYTYILYSNKLAEAKEKFKETMKEVGFQLDSAQNAKWIESLKQGEEVLKKSISVKYLGIKDGQIGILSKRMPLLLEKPNKENHSSQKSLNSIDIKQEYVVNKYSLPHQLHGIIKRNERKKEEEIFLGSLEPVKLTGFKRDKEKELEIKRKIKKMIEKKKENLQEKTKNKIKNSLAAWDSLINTDNKPKILKSSYSSNLKTLSENASQNELKLKVSNIIHSAFYH